MSDTLTPSLLETPSDAHRRRRGMLYIGLATAAVGFAMMLQMGLNDNFLVQDIHLDAYQKGLLEAIRESCGIAAVVILALIVGLKEPVVATLVLVIVGIGLGAYAGVSDFTQVAIFSLVWSQGLHIWMPLPNSMALAIAEPGRSGMRLGQLQAFGAAGSGLGLAVAMALTFLNVPMRPMYAVAGAAAVLGGIFCLRIPRDIKAPGQPLVLRRKYWLYYLMCLLEGWRKQIFLAFAGFLLVKKYGMELSHMLMLWVGIQLLSWLGARRVGRLIDRLGERKILMLYYSAVTCVFLGYTFVTDVHVLAGLFVLDNTFSLLSMALTTYVRRIAPTVEHTATLSMGVAFNHVAAVLMPLVGGLLWEKYGYQAAFEAGVAAAAASVFVAMLIPRRQQPGGATA